VRLTDLQPHWIEPTQWAAPERFYVGLSFLCPHCPVDAPEHGPNRRRRLAVSFYPPIDPSGLDGRMFTWPQHQDQHKRVSGDTFDDLTLAPSVGFESIGHWHGSIVNGAMV